METGFPIAQNESIPNIDFYRGAFEKIKRYAGERDYNKLMKAYLEIFGTYPPNIFQVADGDLLMVGKMYRVVFEEKIMNLDKNKLDSFSHPPSSITSQQRFNTMGSPVLYTASDQHTAIAETAKGSYGKSFYLSTWEFVKDIPLTYMMLFYKNHFNNQSLKDLSDTVETKLDGMLHIYDKEKIEALKYYFEHLTTYSLKDPFDNLTSAIGHYYFYKFKAERIPPLGFICYPSLKMKRDCLNYALHPKLISERVLVCTGIEKRILISQDETKTHAPIEVMGKIQNDGTIVW
ncbi:MAG: RES family NAD+ phosphorylase [Bacteroidia bacterium]|nr:RES family NAD+ phosphorylase [Bacteroidota bacterium]MBP6412078.1 RES family NAD+ phosphorylase [Bacteroidia bacterium]